MNVKLIFFILVLTQTQFFPNNSTTENNNCKVPLKSKLFYMAASAATVVAIIAGKLFVFDRVYNKPADKKDDPQEAPRRKKQTGGQSRQKTRNSRKVKKVLKRQK